MKTLLALALLFAVGCNETPSYHADREVVYRKIILPAQRDAAAAWIIAVVAAANPHSDEEPEDNIAQAETTAVVLFGTPTIGIWASDGRGFACFTPYEALNSSDRKIVDDFLKPVQPEKPE